MFIYVPDCETSIELEIRIQKYFEIQPCKIIAKAILAMVSISDFILDVGDGFWRRNVLLIT